MIINSLLDSDFYKYTMGMLALHLFPTVMVEYAFKCRNEANWTEAHVKRIREEIAHYCTLRLTESELFFLRSLGTFKDSFIDFLRLYQPNINHITVQLIDGQLDIRVKGPWYLTIFFEVPVLAIVNEVYFKEAAEEQPKLRVSGLFKLEQKRKINKDVPFKFADFGTRRRFSGKWQRTVVEQLKEYCPNFIGTSNIMLAKEFNVKPIGTQAHELFQMAQAVYPLHSFQKDILNAWLTEYEGQLGIALTDIVGFDAFLKDFDLHLANAYTGLRHDSGNPFIWADKALQHYRKLGIDPKTKTLVFSDGLDFDLASKLHMSYSDSANVSFGIGTFLTNDFEGITPLQIVMKLVKVNGRPVAKISDSPGKGMCEDPEYVNYLKKVFEIE